MNFAPRYEPAASERHWQATWAARRLYEYSPDDPRPLFAVDTPPPTVSGEIHIGHVYSYIQAEAMIRFWRMQGYNVFYPFGFDDNGLPTERFVERTLGKRARDLGRAEFIAACLETSRSTEDRFEEFWKRLGMSVDWRLRYSTIDPHSRKVSQWSFIDLYRQGRVYRGQLPNPWCTECQTAIAQAEIDDLERSTTFYTMIFELIERDQGSGIRGESQASPAVLIPDPRPLIPIATTRPELLPACVAVFVHPADPRYQALIGAEALVPLSERRVPILADPAVDPQKGSGAVMCCTFGDATDVAWWRAHNLPLIALVTRQGRLSEAGGRYAGLPLAEARSHILADLRAAGGLQGARETAQTVRVHERCGTPLEILETSQWFIRLLDMKPQLLDAGRQISWYPAFMQARYEHWVENLSLDWCISRQRFYGVPFPAWHCADCGAIILADAAQLPCDPLSDAPPRACDCGSHNLHPDEDVMDTWATSSLSPLIASQFLGTATPPLMQLRPQGQEIIRTWAFYTIAKSLLHVGRIPWETIAISGYVTDPFGEKISKSKGNATVTPLALIERYGADAVRYWACGAGLGADQALNEDEIKQGARLVTKLWNAARLIAASHTPATGEEAGNLQSAIDQLQPSDRALLSWLQRLIERVSAAYRRYEYQAARDLMMRFFWNTFCDNYLELVKGRLYDGSPGERQAAQATLRVAFETILTLLAPIMPHISEAIYSQLFAATSDASIHQAAWPQPDAALIDPHAEAAGEAILAIAAAVRRFKTANQLGLGTPLAALSLATSDPALHSALALATSDIRSITRAASVTFDAPTGQGAPGGHEELAPGLWLAIAR